MSPALNARVPINRGIATSAKQNEHIKFMHGKSVYNMLICWMKLLFNAEQVSKSVTLNIFFGQFKIVQNIGSFNSLSRRFTAEHFNMPYLFLPLVRPALSPIVSHVTVDLETI